MKRHMHRVRFLVQTVAIVVAAVSVRRAAAIAAGYRRRYLSVRMEGFSMLPTLHNGKC
jgi:hypothetical protein